MNENKREGFLKPTRVAEYTGLSLNYVNELIEKGELEKVELNGSTRVRMSEVDRWLDEEVDPEELIQMADKVEEDVSVDKVAEMLEMEEEKVRKALNKSD